jgi:hypothetical protein
MSLKANIVDMAGGGTARVTPAGEQVVAPYAYDDTKFLLMDVDDVAYSFFGPRAGHSFIVTLIRAKANRQVSTTVDADVVIFENATGPSDTTQDKIIHQEGMVRGESFTIPMNYRVTEGRWVNGSTTDDDVSVTVQGYYVPIADD